MAVRRLTRRKHGLNGLFPSLKAGRMVWYESFLERDFIHLLEFDPTVVTFAEQPFTLEYVHQGQTRRYTPDFHVQLASQRQVLVECKPSAFLEHQDNPLKFAAARAWCAEHGWSFRVATEVDIRQEPRLANVKLLARYARLNVAPQIQSRVFAALAASPDLSLGELSRWLEPANPVAALPDLLHLAARHAIALALDEAPLSPATQVTLPAPLLVEGP
ncbi:MAG: TnsA-like heteromeric transposase endonuclease subunit [Anaerolineales bacterium]|nr:TnsA-like heteromeric transposase endonuclease subunit [Anaerolineales bacterium]